MKTFVWNSLENILELNEPELFLIKEFKTLLDRDDSPNKSKAFREFTYIFLMIDWASPYADYTDLERHEEAMNESKLTRAEFDDVLFREACKKYQDIQNKDIKMQAVQSAQFLVHRVIDYFDNIVDFNERLESGAPIYKVKDVMTEITNLSKMLDELDELKSRIKKGSGEDTGIRGGYVDGFVPKN